MSSLLPLTFAKISCVDGIWEQVTIAGEPGGESEEPVCKPVFYTWSARLLKCARVPPCYLI